MKFAICNELFTDEKAVGGAPWSWERQCEFSARSGYSGIEVAPFTLGDNPTAISQETRGQMRSTAEAAGVPIIGLHWLLAKTEGLHLTTDNAETRQRTAEYLKALARLCADLGGSVMVLGSPQQRNIEADLSYEQAESNAIEVIAAAVPEFEAAKVVLCLEPLSPAETDFMQTCESARRIIDRIGSPSVRLHQDVKAMSSEDTPIPELIEAFSDVTRHFHANDVNLRGPGMGDVDFRPIFAALKATGYDGFVSVEVFDYEPGAVATAEQSMEYMKQIWANC